MPKQILKLDQFHGGLNSNSDPRDIAPNELSAVTDAAVDELGKLRMMGKNTAHGDAPANAAVINPGYGLFQLVMIGWKVKLLVQQQLKQEMII